MTAAPASSISSAFAGPLLPPITYPESSERAPDAFARSVLAASVSVSDVVFACVVAFAVAALDTAAVAGFASMLRAFAPAAASPTVASAIATRRRAHESGLPILSHHQPKTAEGRRLAEIARTVRYLGLDGRTLAQREQDAREQDAADMTAWRQDEQPGCVVFNMGTVGA